MQIFSRPVERAFVNRRGFLANSASIVVASGAGASLLGVAGQASGQQAQQTAGASAGYTLPELPYAYDALEPSIDARTMEIHYTKHHQGYVDKLNAALQNHPDLKKMPPEDLLRQINAIPEEIRTAVRNNGGGHVNHTLFWKVMSPEGAGEPGGELADAINQKFGSFAAFKEAFTNAGTGVFGSGWAWLAMGDNGLEVTSTANQDNPLMFGKKPILGLDVWEHAYYLKYQNKRPDYVAAWWDVVNWDQVAANYAAVS